MPRWRASSAETTAAGGFSAEGLSNRAIAERLYVAERTVEAHVTQIFLKLGIDGSTNSHRRA